MNIAGQIFGWVAVVLTVVAYQLKTQRQLLWANTLSTLSLSISYLFLGAYTGMALNAFGLFRNFVYFNREKRFFAHPLWPYGIALGMAALGALSWQGPLSLLAIVAMAVNAVFMSFKNVQLLRFSILVTSALLITYNLCFAAYGPAFNEALSIVSSVVGLARYRKM